MHRTCKDFASALIDAACSFGAYMCHVPVHTRIAFPDTNTDGRDRKLASIGRAIHTVNDAAFVRIPDRHAYPSCTQACLGSILSPEFWRSPLIWYRVDRHRSLSNSALCALIIIALSHHLCNEITCKKSLLLFIIFFNSLSEKAIECYYTLKNT